MKIFTTNESGVQTFAKIKVRALSTWCIDFTMVAFIQTFQCSLNESFGYWRLAKVISHWVCEIRRITELPALFPPVKHISNEYNVR